MRAKKIFWVLILSLFAVMLFSFIVDYLLMQKIKASSQEYLDNQELLARFYQREKISKNLQKNYEENQDDLARLDGAFLDFDNTVGFITDLERVAQETNNIFEIKSVSSFSEEDEEEKSFLEFQINILGDSFGLIKFLASLEDTPYPPYRLVEIEDVYIRRLTETDFKKEINSGLKKGDLDSTLKIKVYTQ